MDFYTETNNRFFRMINEDNNLLDLIIMIQQKGDNSLSSVTPEEKKKFMDATGESFDSFVNRLDKIRMTLNPKLKPTKSVNFIYSMNGYKDNDEYLQKIKSDLEIKNQEQISHKISQDAEREGYVSYNRPIFLPAKEFHIIDIKSKSIIGFIHPQTGRGYYASRKDNGSSSLYHSIIAEKICDLLKIPYVKPEIIHTFKDNETIKLLEKDRDSAYKTLIKKSFIRFFGTNDIKEAGAQGHEFESLLGEPASIENVKELQSILQWSDNIVCEFINDKQIPMIQKFLMGADSQMKSSYSILAENKKTKKSINCLLIDFIRHDMNAPSLTDKNDPKLDAARKFLYANRDREDLSYGDQEDK